MFEGKVGNLFPHVSWYIGCIVLHIQLALDLLNIAKARILVEVYG